MSLRPQWLISLWAFFFTILWDVTGEDYSFGDMPMKFGRVTAILVSVEALNNNKAFIF